MRRLPHRTLALDNVACLVALLLLVACKRPPRHEATAEAGAPLAADSGILTPHQEATPLPVSDALLMNHEYGFGAVDPAVSSVCGTERRSASLDGEDPSFAAAHYIGWGVRTFKPVPPATLMAQGGLSVRHIPIPPSLVETLWNELRAARAGVLEKAPCLIDTRLVVSFRSTRGRLRWAAMGRECPILMTEDMVCHPVEPGLFNELVRFLSVSDDIRSGYDPAMAKFLRADNGK